MKGVLILPFDGVPFKDDLELLETMVYAIHAGDYDELDGYIIELAGEKTMQAEAFEKEVDRLLSLGMENWDELDQLLDEVPTGLLEEGFKIEDITIKKSCTIFQLLLPVETGEGWTYV